MKDGSYIKLCRSLLDWEWYGDVNTCRLFIHCLLKANWKAGRFEGVEVPRGSFVTSVSRLASEVGLSVQQTRTAIEHLKSTGELTITTTPKFSIITINNYVQYQSANKVSNKQLTNDQQTTNTRATTIEERKNERSKEGNNNIGRFSPPTSNEVKEYCVNGGYNIDPDAFIDFYESKGWMVGKNKMKDWKAAVRNWARSDHKKKNDERQEKTTNIIDDWRNAL